MQTRDLSRGENPAQLNLRTMTDPASTPPARDPVGWLNNQPYLLLSLTSLFWAGNIVLARHVGNHVPPITLTTIRWFGVFLILLPFAWPHLKRDWPVLRAHLPLMLFLSAIGFAFNNAISYWAMQYTQALNILGYPFVLRTNSEQVVALAAISQRRFSDCAPIEGAAGWRPDRSRRRPTGWSGTASSGRPATRSSMLCSKS